MKDLGYNFATVSKTILCKLFEDNSTKMTLAIALDMKPRTRHINVKYYHFCAYVSNSEISILPIELANKP